MEAIKIKNEDVEIFEKIKLLIQCLSKDKAREVINYVFINEEDIVATDGKIMTVIQNNYRFKPGLYQVEKVQKKEILLIEVEEKFNFPDYQWLIPDSNDYVNLKMSKHYKSEAIRDHNIVHLRLAHLGFYVDYEFIKLMMSYYNSGDISYSGNTKPIIFQKNGIKSIVMPMNPVLFED